MKISELQNEDLDYWVARATGWAAHHLPGDKWPQFSTDQKEALVLIQQYRITIGKNLGATDCYAIMDGREDKFTHQEGPTTMIAAMRCLVANIYGEELQNPDTAQEVRP